jgi:DNA-binding NarL/FixJ family response regulator
LIATARLFLTGPIAASLATANACSVCCRSDYCNRPGAGEAEIAKVVSVEYSFEGSGRAMKANGCGPILIVDDDAKFRGFVSALFARAGFETIEAASGEEALAGVRAERPALVLLDVSLPDISGFEICSTLRGEFGQELPIFFVSGKRVEPRDRAVGLLLGGDDYIVKPFDPDEFLARTRRAIARSRPGQASLTPEMRDFALTPRELEVLQRLAEGDGAKEIAYELVISPKTVRSHVQRVLAKLGVHSRVQAVAMAYQHGLVAGPMERSEEKAAEIGQS